MPQRLLAVLLTAVLLTLTVTGCSLKERICRSGEHPVKAVGNATGRTCVRDGTDPPSGYVPYPAGKVPVHVDDEWDRYWSDKVLDERGLLVSPSPA
ncbi:hypothetical protein OHA72_58015 [Dactylosporangium sp. NBC_01737]|uniref:SCO0607 family lipoprotein n=1 Tax=Dactylosporangium sp. NBC_01737 TaxID=2975959 RepID=UPI002E136F51|nr:hypothetical protein OHA72_58015 [Dactylosporangium sp. NBC_01737]